MSSILTNSSAMVALETLRGINKNLGQVQSEISTGKKVSNSKDSAAIYAISTVMSSDVSSFDKISDSLNLGSATVGVARAASEQVVDILTDMKDLIVSAQEDNVDRAKIQTDVAALKSQIDTIVGSAQFNGQNLVSGTGSVDILASLDRASNGTVTASNINVARANLETSDAVPRPAITSGNAGYATIPPGSVVNGATKTVTYTAGAILEGDEFTVDLLSGFDGTATYTAQSGDTLADVGAALTAILDGFAGYSAAFTPNADPLGTDSVITVTNSTGFTSSVSASALTGEAVAAGGLNGLNTLTVATESGATSALAAIDDLLSTAINAASGFGSAQKRIDMQDTFVNSLMDSMKVGIGALVDADLEEASARLQSLQVQQQLGVQALSIANQAPQSLLSLFR